jgi:hypothetical protein
MFEWTGDWSDDSRQWTPQLLAELNYALDVLDGTFWISFTDFLQYFVFFEVCMVRQPHHQRPWTEVRRKLWMALTPPPPLLSLSSPGVPGADAGSSPSSAPLLLGDKPLRISCMFILQLDSQTPTEVYFSAHQPNKLHSHSHGSLYFDIGVTVLRIESNGTFTFACSSGLAVERQVQATAVLDPGVYIVIPMTSGTKLKQYQLQRENSEQDSPTGESFSAVRLLDAERERFSKEVDAVFDEIFDRFDTDNDGVSVMFELCLLMLCD